MPRQQPLRPKPRLLPQTEEAPATLPPVNDSVYRALCVEESKAYRAWLLFDLARDHESKGQLSQLRRLYEEKRNERQAYQSSIGA